MERLKMNIQLFADDKSEETPKTDSEEKTPNPIDDIRANYEARISALEQKNKELQEKVNDYSAFLKTAPIVKQEPKKSSDDLISNLIKGGRFNG